MAGHRHAPERIDARLSEAASVLAVADWTTAATLFGDVLADSADPPTRALALEGLARCRWWLDDGPGCLAALEDAYRAHRAAGDVRGAARAATSLGYDSALFGRGSAVAQGWLGRARELLQAREVADGSAHQGPNSTSPAQGPAVPAQGPAVPEQGWLTVREAELCLNVTHDPHAALECARRTHALGLELGHSDLELVGTALTGFAEVQLGRPDEGLARLDTAAAGALGGDVADLMWVGKICCWLVAACQQVQDFSRAAQWCERVEELCASRGLDALMTTCRVQHAAVHVATGRWSMAESALAVVIDGSQQSTRSFRIDAVVQLGELRRRQGRLDDAWLLLDQAEFDPRAIVSRALILIERGEPERAWTSVRGVLDSAHPADRLRRGVILLSALRCAVAAGATGEAAGCLAELQALDAQLDSPPLHAQVHVARSLLADPHERAALLGEAVRTFREAGMPFDEAEARLALAGVLGSEGVADEARRHAGIAAQLLDALGADERADAARALIDVTTTTAAPVADTTTGPLSARETEVLALVAGGLTNADIAARLVISEHTVHRHISNILTKLGQPTRAAATAYALTAGLL